MGLNLAELLTWVQKCPKHSTINVCVRELRFQPQCVPNLLRSYLTSNPQIWSKSPKGQRSSSQPKNVNFTLESSWRNAEAFLAFETLWFQLKRHIYYVKQRRRRRKKKDGGRAGTVGWWLALQQKNTLVAAGVFLDLEASVCIQVNIDVFERRKSVGGMWQDVPGERKLVTCRRRGFIPKRPQRQQARVCGTTQAQKWIFKPRSVISELE